MSSHYELMREENIKRNNDKLRELGLRAAATTRDVLPVRQPQQKKRKRNVVQKAPVPERRSSRLVEKAPVPERRSSRRVAGIMPLDQIAQESLDNPLTAQLVEWPPRSEQLSKNRRPSVAQTEFLISVDAGSMMPADLSPDELASAKRAEEGLHKGFGASGRQLGTQLYYSRARGVLREAGVRRPAWVNDLESSDLFAGKSPENTNQTMFVIERGCAGMGMRVNSWPETVGVLMSRPLTLSSDVETLKLAGARLENKHGIDRGNGWAYRHALGYVKKFQALKLGSQKGAEGECTGKRYETIFAGPSLHEVAEEGVRGKRTRGRKQQGGANCQL